MYKFKYDTKNKTSFIAFNKPKIKSLQVGLVSAFSDYSDNLKDRRFRRFYVCSYIRRSFLY